MRSSFLPTGIGYVYSWGDDVDDALLTIEVSNLRSRNGSPYALLSTSTAITGARVIPGSDERVLNGELWLLSDRDRANYANALRQRIPTPEGAATIDFDAILEEVAQRVLDNENAPVAVSSLDIQLPVPPSIPDLVEGVIPAHKPTILYGAGGVGKSILAACVAVCVASGHRFLGFRTMKTDVLYLDWETDEGDINLRVRAAAAGLGIVAPPIRYSSLVRPLEDRVAQLARFVAEEGVGLVIIDSVGMAMNAARDGGDASETAIRFFRALRSLNTAVLALDHVAGEDMRKAKSGAAKPYGSVYKWNSARNAFELRERKEPDAKGSHLLLKHRKSNVGPRMGDTALLMKWEGDKAIFETEKWNPGPAMPLDARIIEMLSTGPATPHQLADLLSDSDNPVYEIDVRRVVRTLLMDKQVTALADGTVRALSMAADPVDSTLLPADD